MTGLRVLIVPYRPSTLRQNPVLTGPGSGRNKISSAPRADPPDKTQVPIHQLTGFVDQAGSIYGSKMSNHRVLVDLAAKRAFCRSPLLGQRSLHHDVVVRARRRVANSVPAGYPISDSRRLHTTTQSARETQQQNQQQQPSPTQPPFRNNRNNNRRPRTFRLTPPQPPSVHPHSSSSPDASHLPLSEQLRSVMRLLTHPVVVCTATHPSSSSSSSSNSSSSTKPVPRAMTMSSFTSLTLTPTPLISFNIATPSRTLDAVVASRQFNIHVLADDADGARLADWFAGGNAAPDPDVADSDAALVGSPAAAGGRGGDVFERLVREGGVQVSSSEGAPLLEGDGVLYVLRCRLLEDGPGGGLVRVRDHVIVVGEVVDIVEGVGAQRETEEQFGLLYADRRYRQLGQCITPNET
ncbi:hypothetical protein VTJ04DRAFT_7782 [Mycothermus thermophilus]|uniref:uncharacterized protein n=1 Tax=Humicola insolens TaxID=85995 RepID=UPI003743AEEA